MVRYTKPMVILIAMTLVPVIYTAELSSSADQAMIEHQNLGLLEVLSDDMLNAQIAPYLSLRDIACVRRACRYLSKHFWDHERVWKFDTSDLLRTFKVNSLAEGLRALSTKLVNRDNPIELNLYGSDLIELPAEIQQLTQLRVLNLGLNNLCQQAMRNICHEQSQLRRLDLSFNCLTGLPAEVQQLKQLEILNLGHNNLSKQAVRNICHEQSQLQQLKLQQNCLTELPAEIQQLTQLKRLDLGYNNLGQQAIRNICLWIPQLQRLNLTLNELTELPAEIQQLTQLKRLYLWSNGLEQEQGQIGIWLPNTDIQF